MIHEFTCMCPNNDNVIVMLLLITEVPHHTYVLLLARFYSLWCVMVNNCLIKFTSFFDHQYILLNVIMYLL